MSLDCLSCQVLQRTNSDNELEHVPRKPYRETCFAMVERGSWSGNLNPPPPPYEKMRSGKSMLIEKVKKGHRRLHSTGTVAFEGSGEPRLVRSCGMRRDWSFEDLRDRDKKRKEGIAY
ncbi:hypothetical protein CFOL_v3_01572 [Cephalotus follicularis]|uniref:Uncharacterized protein n=1 Tax=Cephalotus follicularis TaxID=3775 RepID=A0A1Q3AQJ8_CEPFO|nr:hypothetical protein CFOL_v3_01572 [Cephalotus follicularis]